MFGGKLFDHADFAGGKIFSIQLQNGGLFISGGIGITPRKGRFFSAWNVLANPRAVSFTTSRMI